MKNHRINNTALSIILPKFILVIIPLLLILSILNSKNIFIELIIAVLILLILNIYLFTYLITLFKKIVISFKIFDEYKHWHSGNNIKEEYKFKEILMMLKDINNTLKINENNGSKTVKSHNNYSVLSSLQKVPVAQIKNKKKSFLDKVEEALIDHFDDPMFDVQRLADTLYISRAQLYRKFKIVSDIPIAVFLRKFRLKKAKELLEKSDYNVSQIMYKTGFINLTSFSRAFKEEYGKSPRFYKSELDKSYV